ncbi:MAG: heme exporter protein CcmB [Magnetococcales bacterium]|nr:heme exporter protein CcmB [Magnetococcales bacterium]MBF0174124.1 heme exporter protein CcmB [Magnetococcales bacterium]MBF0632007.1 heme exporter protein CcmB [Magnetococcales bacterium]
MLKAIYRLAWKDVLADFRHRSTFSSMLFFSVAVLLVFQAAFEPNGQEAQRLVPGLLWTTVLFTTLMGLGRVFQSEEENGAFEGLLLTPLPRGAIFFGKWLGNLVLSLMVMIMLIPLTLILFNVNIWIHIPMLLALLLLGTMGLTALGVLLAAMTQTARSRETLLALLLLPLVAPLLIAGVQAMTEVINTGTLGGPWLNLLLIFDAIYLSLAPWGFGWLVEE